jgi:hypothetical protein
MEQVECTHCKQKGFASVGGYHHHLNRCKDTATNSNPMIMSSIAGGVPQTTGGREPIAGLRTNNDTCSTRSSLGSATENFMTSMLSIPAGNGAPPQDTPPDDMSLLGREAPPPCPWLKLDPMVIVGNKLLQCEFVTKHHFVPPSDFSPSYLRKAVNTTGHVQFRNNAD